MDPYLNCIPSLCHHQIGPEDKFLVLSSDGLYQYFTNKEVVDQVQMFTAANPEGDPAQHLVRELLLRAARKAGEQPTLSHLAVAAQIMYPQTSLLTLFICRLIFRYGVPSTARGAARRQEELP
jgi:hypothetical protein